jgi:hypothetical protein
MGRAVLREQCIAPNAYISKEETMKATKMSLSM